VFEKLEKLNQNLADSKRREKKLIQETAKIEGDRLKGLLQSGNSAWTYRADASMEFFTGVIDEIKDVVKDTGLVVLASGEGKKGGQVIIIGEKRRVEEMSEKVKTVVKSIKGGGGGTKWQGKVLEWGKGEVEELRKLVEEQ
jgi:misacylated tRNA(Ala) deacylase